MAHEERQPFGKQRMEALSDGIYAIAMTLLVLDLKIPSLPAGVSEHALQRSLLDLLPRGITWLSSFGVMSLLWMGQQRIYALCTSLDVAMVWSELAQLAFISLFPFTAAFAAAYRSHVTAAVLYGVHLLVITVFSYLRTSHLLRQPTLHSPNLSPQIATRIRQRARLLFACAAATIALAFAVPTWSVLGMLPIALFRGRTKG